MLDPKKGQMKCDWLVIFTIFLTAALLIMIQPAVVCGEDNPDMEDDFFHCCDGSENCGLHKSDCDETQHLNEWNCPETFNFNTSIVLLGNRHGIPEIQFSWSNEGRVFLETRHSPSSTPTSYSVAEGGDRNHEICSRLSKMHLYTTLKEQSSGPNVSCRVSSLLISTLSSYNIEDLSDPETWASYLVVRYQSIIPSINVTFLQADEIAEFYGASELSYNIELLRRSSLANHSPWEISDKAIVYHDPEKGLERTVSFVNMSVGDYEVRFQLELEYGCSSYCPYMYSETITISEPPPAAHHEVQQDVTVIEYEATNILGKSNEVVRLALVAAGCSLVIFGVFVFFVIKFGFAAQCKEIALNLRRENQSSPRPCTSSPPDFQEETEHLQRKVFIVYTQESTSPEGSSLHEEVVRHFVNLLIGQIRVDVRTVELCIRDVRCLKPRKWVHQQLDACDIIVIINSASAMERVKSAYFKDVEKWSAELQNANIVDNVFDIAMEGIMARLQSGHIKDCPSRYAVVTFPHSDSVENLIPYLSTEMNYRLMSDWHAFCMHLKDVGASSPEMLHQSYEILSSVDGIKLQEAMDNAESHYTWSDINNADDTESLSRNVSHVLTADRTISQIDHHVHGHGVTDEWQPSKRFDSGFDSHGSLDEMAVDFYDGNANNGNNSILNHSKSVDASEPLLMNRHHPPDDIDFIPPTVWSSSETLSTNISENQGQLNMLPYQNALRRINDLPLQNKQIC